MRSIPSVMAMGQAARTAAALCVRQGTSPAELDVSLLKAELAEQDVQFKLGQVGST